MSSLRFNPWIFCVVLPMVQSGLAYGQTYPRKPIRIVTAGVGSGGDFTARFVSQGISERLGQPIVVDNRGGGVIQGEIVSRSTPDGYTLLVAGATLWIGPLLREGTPYDPVKDFEPITLVSKSSNVLVVHPSIPVSSVKELIAYAKARSGALNYSSGGTGGAPHLAAELFKSMTGANITRIPYKSGAIEIGDLIGGRVQLTFGSGEALMPHVKAGKLRALATTGPDRSALFPDLPTVSASGLPGYQVVNMSGVLAPANTPRAIIVQLNQEIAAYVSTPEGRGMLLSAGVEGVGNSAAQFAAIIKSEISRFGKVIKDAGIRAD